MKTMEMIRYEAEMFICGSVECKISHRMRPRWGKWSNRLLGHPTVTRADREGWAADLRMHLRREIAALVFGGKAIGTIYLDDVMPPIDLQKHWALNAERGRLGAAWREANQDDRAINGNKVIGHA